MAVKLIDELQKEIKAAGEAVTQEAYEKAYDHTFQILDNLGFSGGTGKGLHDHFVHTSTDTCNV